MISFCCPTFNRFEFTCECVDSVIDHHKISEVVISDDASTDGSYEKLVNYYGGIDKVRIFRNERNRDCYVNKKISVELATNKYCLLGDSDNKFSLSFIDKLFEHYWDRDTLLAPDFSKPMFDYRAYSGLTISKENINEYLDFQYCTTMLNTMNYFFNRNSFLEVWDGSIDPIGSDSIFQNYNWLKSGKKIFVVPGLEYEHRVHDGSHFQNNIQASMPLINDVIQKIKQLR